MSSGRHDATSEPVSSSMDAPSPRMTMNSDDEGTTGLSFNVPALPEGTGIQPRLDSIFAEVQANLPSIDFEVSDVRRFDVWG